MDYWAKYLVKYWIVNMDCTHFSPVHTLNGVEQYWRNQADIELTAGNQHGN